MSRWSPGPPSPPTSDRGVQSDEARMDRFIRLQNLERYRKQLEETNDAAKRRTLLELLMEEEVRDVPR